MKNTMESIFTKIKNNFLLITVLIIAVVIRIWALGEKSLWIDEVYFYFFTSEETLFDNILSMYADVHPPIYYLFVYFWTNTFGDSEFMLRMTASLPGIAAVIAVYYLACKHFNKHTAINATILTGFSPFMLYYSQEARCYSLIALFSIIATYFWIKIIKKINENNLNSSTLVLYSVFALMTLFTHYFAFIFIGLQILYLIIFALNKKAFTKNILKTSGIILLIAGGQLIFHYLIAIKHYRVFDPTFSKVSESHPLLQIMNQIFYDNCFFFIALLVLSALNYPKLRAFFIKEFSEKKLASPVIYLSYLLIAPIISYLIVNEFSTLMHPRHIIYIVPVAYLLISYLLDKNNILNNCIVFIFCSIFLGIYLFAGSYYEKPKQEWRKSTAYLLKNFGDDTAVILDRVKGYYSYYFEKNGRDIFKMENVFEDKKIFNPDEIKEKITNYKINYKNVVIYSTTMLDTDKKHNIIQEELASSCKELRKKDFVNIIFYECY